MLGWDGSRCGISTKAMPVSMGSAVSSLRKASRPPAEAPIPTTGKVPIAVCCGGVTAARRRGRGAVSEPRGRSPRGVSRPLRHWALLSVCPLGPPAVRGLPAFPPFYHHLLAADRRKKAPPRDRSRGASDHRRKPPRAADGFESGPLRQTIRPRGFWSGASASWPRRCRRSTPCRR